MSKAFTREDQDAGFDLPTPPKRLSESRLTAYGARIVRDRLADLDRGAPSSEGGSLSGDRLRALATAADVIEPATGVHVALGARVRVRSKSKGKGERVVVIVTPDEVGIVPDGISAASPLASVLIGAEVGQTVELELPRGTEELKVLAIDWPR